jgi:hypothetical protein
MRLFSFCVSKPPKDAGLAAAVPTSGAQLAQLSLHGFDDQQAELPIQQ